MLTSHVSAARGRVESTTTTAPALLTHFKLSLNPFILTTLQAHQSLSYSDREKMPPAPDKDAKIPVSIGLGAFAHLLMKVPLTSTFASGV